MTETEHPIIAAVDLGSNSFHLVLARKVDGHLQILHKEKQRVFLAAGLSSTNQLSEDAIERGVAVLKQFAITLENIPKHNVKVVATYTLRRAKNAWQFMAKAKQVFPYHIDIIAGQEEARLIYQGVAHNLHHEKHRLVIDIGGGSTELIIGKHFKHKLLSSRNMGCVSYTKQFFPNGKITKKRFEHAILRAEQELEAISATYNKHGWKHVIGTSGTIKTLLLLTNESENALLTLAHLTQLKKVFVEAAHIDNLDYAILSPERKATICGGLAVLIAVFKQLEISELNYCDYSLREGVLYEMQDTLAHKDIRVNTINNLIERYVIDTQQAHNISGTLHWLFAQIAHTWQLSEKHHLPLLLWAAQLHEIGLSINSSGLHKHSAYIVSNAQLAGFTQEQQQLLTCLIRFYRKKIKPEEIPTLVSTEPKKLHRLMALFRLAVLLNQKRRQHGPNTEYFAISVAKHNLNLGLTQKWLTEHSLLAADLRQEQLQLSKLGITLGLV